MNKLKFTYQDFNSFEKRIQILDNNNIDYTIETDYEDSYYITIK